MPLKIFFNLTMAQWSEIYLHLDQERQRETPERIDHPHKQWKHNPSDWDEHTRWDQ